MAIAGRAGRQATRIDALNLAALSVALAFAARLVAMPAAMVGSLFPTGSATEEIAQPPQATAETAVRIALRSDGPRSLDPARATSTYDFLACAQLFEGLLRFKLDERTWGEGERPTAATDSAPPAAAPLAEVEPALAESMPTVRDNPDGTQTWTFDLRPAVRFHAASDPRPNEHREVTASDVAYSYKRLADPSLGLANWWLLEDTIVGLDEFQQAELARFRASEKGDEQGGEENLGIKGGYRFDADSPVPGLRIVSPSRIEITLRRPTPRFAWAVAMVPLSVVPRHAAEPLGEAFGRHPLGTGPYLLREGDWLASRTLMLRRNAEWHGARVPTTDAKPGAKTDADTNAGPPGEPRGAGGHPTPPLAHQEAKRDRGVQPDRLEFVMYPTDPPMWLDFERGVLSVVPVPGEFYAQAFNPRTGALRPEFAVRGVRVHRAQLLDFVFRGFNMEDPVFGGYTDDRVKLRRAISLAYDLPALNDAFYAGLATVYDGPIPPGLSGHPPGGASSLASRGPDLPLARRLLAEAGYPGGEGLGELTLHAARSASAAQLVQREQDFLSRIGVRLRPRVTDFSEFQESLREARAPFFAYAWGCDYPDAESTLALFYSRNRSPGSNCFNYARPEYDALYERAIALPIGPERRALYEQMRDMLIRDCVFVGSLCRSRVYLAQPGVLGFHPSELAFHWVSRLRLADVPGPVPAP